MYRRRPGAPPATEDSELAALPAEMRASVMQAIERLETITETGELKTRLEQMEDRREQVTEDLRPVIDYLIKKTRERLEALGGASG
jgi:hypothetical protein